MMSLMYCFQERKTSSDTIVFITISSHITVEGKHGMRCDSLGLVTKRHISSKQCPIKNKTPGRT